MLTKLKNFLSKLIKPFGIFLFVALVIGQGYWNYYQNKQLRTLKKDNKTLKRQIILTQLSIPEEYDDYDITDRLDSLESSNGDLESNVEDVSTKLDTVSSDLEDLQHSIKKYGGLEYRIAELEGWRYYGR